MLHRKICGKQIEYILFSVNINTINKLKRQLFFSLFLVNVLQLSVRTILGTTTMIVTLDSLVSVNAVNKLLIYVIIQGFVTLANLAALRNKIRSKKLFNINVFVCAYILIYFPKKSRRMQKIRKFLRIERKL